MGEGAGVGDAHGPHLAARAEVGAAGDVEACPLRAVVAGQKLPRIGSGADIIARADAVARQADGHGGCVLYPVLSLAAVDAHGGGGIVIDGCGERPGRSAVGRGDGAEAAGEVGVELRAAAERTKDLPLGYLLPLCPIGELQTETLARESGRDGVKHGAAARAEALAAAAVEHLPLPVCVSVERPGPRSAGGVGHGDAVERGLVVAIGGVGVESGVAVGRGALVDRGAVSVGQFTAVGGDVIGGNGRAIELPFAQAHAVARSSDFEAEVSVSLRAGDAVGKQAAGRVEAHTLAAVDRLPFAAFITA